MHLLAALTGGPPSRTAGASDARLGDRLDLREGALDLIQEDISEAGAFEVVEVDGFVQLTLRRGVEARAAAQLWPAQVGDAAGVFAFQGELLDQAYLDTWAEALGVTALLADVRSCVGGGGPADEAAPA